MSKDIQVGEAIQIGRYVTQFADQLGAFDAKAFLSMSASQRQAYLKNLAAPAARIAAAAKASPAIAKKIRPTIHLATAAQTAMAQMQAAVSSAEAKGVTDRLAQATHVIPVCFDNVATVSPSGIATVSAPHNRPWRFLGVMANDAQTSVVLPPRLISLKIAGTEHIIASNVVFSSGSPTSPGVDLSVFSTKNHLALKPEFRWRFWGMGIAGVMRSDAQILMQVYNPAGASQSVNLSLLVQSSPCGDDDGFYSTEKGGVHASNDPVSIKFMANLARGGMRLYR